MTAKTASELQDLLLSLAQEAARRGPGYAQQAVVLGEAQKRLGISAHDVEQEQALLTCWHDLFRDGRLSWGFNLDNPGPPFFHLPRRKEPGVAPATAAYPGVLEPS